MIDSCGSAGGRLPGQGGGGYGAGYVNTTHSKIGDLGSKTLPVHDTGTMWAAGKQYEVAWTIQAVSNHHGPMQRCLPSLTRAGPMVAQNHGGGYSYRLCPLNSPDLNEDCFNEHPVKMVGQSKLRWGGEGGRELAFDAVTVTEGTKAGVMWRKNPVPRAWKTKDGKWGKGSNHLQTGVGFQPVRVPSTTLPHCTARRQSGSTEWQHRE